MPAQPRIITNNTKAKWTVDLAEADDGTATFIVTNASDEFEGEAETEEEAVQIARECAAENSTPPGYMLTEIEPEDDDLDGLFVYRVSLNGIPLIEESTPGDAVIEARIHANRLAPAVELPYFIESRLATPDELAEDLGENGRNRWCAKLDDGDEYWVGPWRTWEHVAAQDAADHLLARVQLVASKTLAQQGLAAPPDGFDVDICEPAEDVDLAELPWSYDPEAGAWQASAGVDPLAFIVGELERWSGTLRETYAEAVEDAHAQLQAATCIIAGAIFAAHASERPSIEWPKHLAKIVAEAEKIATRAISAGLALDDKGGLHALRPTPNMLGFSTDDEEPFAKGVEAYARRHVVKTQAKKLIRRLYGSAYLRDEERQRVDGYRAAWAAGKLESHPFADLFPMMAPDDAQGLRRSIEAHGYDDDEPLVVLGGKVLDGRNRRDQSLAAYQATNRDACQPVFAEFQGDELDALAWVNRRNFARRHLTPSEKAVIAADMAERLETLGASKLADKANADHRRNLRGWANEEAAKSTGASVRGVQRMRAIREQGPGVWGQDETDRVIAQIRAGEASIKPVERRLREDLDAQAKDRARKAGEQQAMTMFGPDDNGQADEPAQGSADKAPEAAADDPGADVQGERSPEQGNGSGADEGPCADASEGGRRVQVLSLGPEALMGRVDWRTVETLVLDMSPVPRTIRADPAYLTLLDTGEQALSAAHSWPIHPDGNMWILGNSRTVQTWAASLLMDRDLGEYGEVVDITAHLCVELPEQQKNPRLAWQVWGDDKIHVLWCRRAGAPDPDTAKLRELLGDRTIVRDIWTDFDKQHAVGDERAQALMDAICSVGSGVVVAPRDMGGVCALAAHRAGRVGLCAVQHPEAHARAVARLELEAPKLNKPKGAKAQPKGAAPAKKKKPKPKPEPKPIKGKRNLRTQDARDGFDRDVLEAMRKLGGVDLAAASIRKPIDADAAQLRAALNRLIEKGQVAWQGKGPGTRYSIIEAGQ